jgi:hypothetical protein
MSGRCVADYETELEKSVPLYDTISTAKLLNCEYARKQSQKPQVRNQLYSDSLEINLGQVRTRNSSPIMSKLN